MSNPVPHQTATPEPAQEPPAPEPLPRALIVTVGVPADPRVDLARALVDDIARLRPERLILVASAESHANAERLAGLLAFEPDKCEIVRLESAHDLEETFRKVNAAINHLHERGIRPAEIAINFTSGTKMMGSGAVLSAVFNRCMELRYLTGAEAGARRRTVIKTHPSAVFAYQDLLRGMNLIRELQFGPAASLLRNIDDSLLTGPGRHLRLQLMATAEAYGHREAFHPGRFLAAYERIEFGAAALEPFAMSEPQLGAVRRLAAEVQRGATGRDVLTELYNDGLRRLHYGAPDDAVIRLYRAMEFLAQWVLLRDFEIDSNDVDTRRIPPRDRVSYEATRSIEDGTVRLGLRKSFDLLVVLKTRVGMDYRKSASLREFLARRSTSILAHGLAPTDLADARTYFAAARQLFEVEIEKLTELCGLLQFPWIDSDGSARPVGMAVEQALAAQSGELKDAQA